MNKLAMATVSARRGGAKAPVSKKLHTREVTIQPSDNHGFTINHHMANDQDGEGEGMANGRYIPPPAPEQTVHKNWGEAKTRLNSIFAPKAAGPVPAAAPPAQDDEAAEGEA